LISLTPPPQVEELRAAAWDEAVHYEFLVQDNDEPCAKPLLIIHRARSAITYDRDEKFRALYAEMAKRMKRVGAEPEEVPDCPASSPVVVWESRAWAIDALRDCQRRFEARERTQVLRARKDLAEELGRLFEHDRAASVQGFSALLAEVNWEKRAAIERAEARRYSEEVVSKMRGQCIVAGQKLMKLYADALPSDACNSEELGRWQLGAMREEHRTRRRQERRRRLMLAA